jgi:thioredoxin 1
MTNPTIVQLTDATFEAEVLSSTEPVLVDFWAEWCGPCKSIAPLLEDIASQYQGRLKVAKLNIDDNPRTAPRFGVRGIPTLLLMKDGKVIAQKIGAPRRADLTAMLDGKLDG